MKKAQVQKRLKAAFILVFSHFSSNGYSRIHRPVRFGLFNGQSVQQPLQLSAAYAHCRTRLHGPFESPSFESPVIKPKSIVIPAQYFQLVPLPIAENKPLFGKRIYLKHGAHKSRQTVNGFP
jgi:hypothetical protein